LSADDVVAAHFPIVTISIISAMLVGIAGIFFKLKDIRNDNRKGLETSIEQRVRLEEVLNKLKFHIQEQDKKIERLENIIFKFPGNGKYTPEGVKG
jgi:hypothetical protein